MKIVLIIFFFLLLLTIAFLLKQNNDIRIEKKMITQKLYKEQLIREVEVSIWETSNATFFYTSYPTKTSKQEYLQQLADVTSFMTKYSQVINSKEEKAILKKFNLLWKKTVAQADVLFVDTNKIELLQKSLWNTINQLDDIIEYKIQPSFKKGSINAMEKERLILKIETSIWQVFSNNNYYTHKLSYKPKDKLKNNILKINNFIGEYKQLKLNSEEIVHAVEFNNKWVNISQLLTQYEILLNNFYNEKLVFWDLLHEIDDIIDFEIQNNFTKLHMH
ncbi:MAG: hypothetical protein COA79_21555 [Planctomycetota bacterium]|nr:MAG: hypothetical protein COA79_21555 [Planctomycetota bacterium]